MEEEKILTEAEAVQSELPEEVKDLEYTDLASEEWNRVFKKYLNYKEIKQNSPTDYYAINVKVNVDRVKDDVLNNLGTDLRTLPDPNGAEKGNKIKSGYIQLAGATGEQQRIIIHKLKATVDPEQVKITQNKDDASLFTEKDAKTIISALKRISGLKASYALSKVDAKEAQSKLAQEQDLAHVIFDMYLDKASDGLRHWLGNGYDTLYRICRTLQYPLSSNDFLQIFINAHQDSNLRNHVNPTSQFVWLVNNAIADRLCSYKGLLKPKSFLNTLIFNSGLWVISFNQVKDIFEAYNKLINLTMPSYLKGYNQSIVARNIILAGKESDIVSFIENEGKGIAADSEEGSEEAIKLISYGKSPEDENILNTPIRPLSVINKILSDLEPEEGEDIRRYIIRLVTFDGKNTLADTEVEVTLNEEEEIEEKLVLKNSLKKDDKIRLTRVFGNSSKLFIPRLSDWDQEDFDQKTDDKGEYYLVAKQDIESGTFDYSASWTGTQLMHDSLFRSSKAVAAAEEEPEKEETAEEQPAPNSPSAKNTLADLSKMSKQDLAANFSGNELKDIASQAASLLSKASAGAGIQQPIADTK